MGVLGGVGGERGVQVRGGPLHLPALHILGVGNGAAKRGRTGGARHCIPMGERSWGEQMDLGRGMGSQEDKQTGRRKDRRADGWTDTRMEK